MYLKTELASILPGLQPISVCGVWCRAVRTDLLSVPGGRVIWPHGAPVLGQRFTQRGGPPSIYLASDMVTALSEVRAVQPAAASVLPVTTATSVWSVAAINTQVHHILDLTSPEIQSALGTDPAELLGPWRLKATGQQAAPTQHLGQAVFESQRFLGIKYASAQHAPGSCLVVFDQRLGESIDCFLEVIDHGRLRQRLPPNKT